MATYAVAESVWPTPNASRKGIIVGKCLAKRAKWWYNHARFCAKASAEVVTILKISWISGFAVSQSQPGTPLVRSYILYLFQGIHNGSKCDMRPEFYRTCFDATQGLNLVYVSSFFGRRAGGISCIVVWCSFEKPWRRGSIPSGVNFSSLGFL